MAAKKKTGGRKKGTPNKATTEMKALAQEYGAEAIKGIVDMARNSKQDATRLAAWKELIDRGYGKAVQGIELTGNLALTHEEALDELEGD